MKGTVLRPVAGRIRLFSLGSLALAAAVTAGLVATGGSTVATGAAKLAAGATLHVVASGGGDTPGCPASSPCSLGHALAQAKGVDPPTVDLAAGTYNGTMWINFPVNVVGAGEGYTVLKDLTVGSPTVVVDSGTVNISQLTITGGMGSGETIGAGGLDNAANAHLTLSNVLVTGNSFTDGDDGAGGIANLGTLNLVNSAVTRNAASVSKSCSGGIANDGTMVLQNTVVSQNSCTGQYIYGSGGISDGGSTLVYQDHASTLDVYQSTVTNNSSAALDNCNCAENASGGILVGPDSTLYLSSTTVAQNAANSLFVSLGGGLFNLGTATLNASNFSANTVNGPQGSGGGGIYNDGDLTVQGSTGINTNNGNFGGGLYNDCSGTTTLTGTTLKSDVATVGIDIFSDGTLNMSSVSVNQANVLQSPDSSGYAECDVGEVSTPP